MTRVNLQSVKLTATIIDAVRMQFVRGADWKGREGRASTRLQIRQRQLDI